MTAPAAVRVRVEAAAVAASGCAVVGEVISVGDAATEWMGRRVIVATLSSCGECDFCRRGAPTGCADAHRLDASDVQGEELEVKARFLTACDGELEVAGPSAAILGSDGLLAYGAFCALGVAPGEPVVVVGDGTASELVRQIAAAKSARVLDLETARAEAGDKPWRAFALEVGRDPVETLLAALPHGSRVAIAAHDERHETLPFASLSQRAITIAFVGAGHPDLLPELVALAARRELDLEKSVSSSDDRLTKISVR